MPVEQITKIDKEHHVDKLDMAKRRITRCELDKYNIYMTETQLETFIESSGKADESCVEGRVIMALKYGRSYRLDGRLRRGKVTVSPWTIETGPRASYYCF